MTDRSIAVVPARGGSKRVPRKNVRGFLGRPMIDYTIAAALESGLFERVVVSTDSEEIAEISRAAGADVPFLRDPSLADDHTPVSAATADVLRRLDPTGERYGQVCQLMANCPLRDAEDVSASHEQFSATGARAQISVVRYGWQNPWWALRRDHTMTVEPLFPDVASARSQDLPELFCPTGAVWWAQARALRDHSSYHLPGRTGWEIDWQHGVDIDTEDDWAMAEVLMRLELDPGAER